jgi:hypothetical protein
MPLVRPVISNGLDVAEESTQLLPLSIEYWYPVIGAFGSEVPALNVTERNRLPDTTDEMVGAPGAAAGKVVTLGLDSTEIPIPLAAITLTK